MLVIGMKEVLVERWMELRFYHIRKGRGGSGGALTLSVPMVMIGNLE